MAEYLWNPPFAGESALVTAAKKPNEKHSFDTKYGKVDIECFWAEAQDDDPAYIWLSWNADVNTEGELQIYFANPETLEILREVSVGTRYIDAEMFTSQELGFDPSTERWAIAVSFNVEEA